MAKISITRRVSDERVGLVKMLANGKKVAEIAEQMKISRRTLEDQLEKMRAEYGCVNITHLVSTFYKEGILKSKK